MASRRAGKRATLADVAALAKVSVQTASHVLSRSPRARVAAETRRRVEEAARTLSYQPNPHAQAMQRGRTGLIAVWVPLDRPTLLYLRMLNALSRRAQASGRDLLVYGLDSETALLSGERLPRMWPVDGLIALDSMKAVQRFRGDALNDGVPLVHFGLEEYANGDSIAWNVEGAARRATSAALAAGRKNVVQLTPQWILDNFPREQRRRGYAAEMEAAGRTPQYVAALGESIEAGEMAIAAHLHSNPAPDAIVCFNDSLAVGAVNALLDAGVSVPEGCEVFGFGDSPEGIAARVPLSTFRVPVEPIAATAWGWLTERIEAGALATRFELVEMEFVERRSTDSRPV